MKISLVSPTQASIYQLIKLSKQLHDHEALPFNEVFVSNAFSFLIENPSHGNVFMIVTERDNNITDIIGYIVICYSFSIEYGGQIALLDQFYLSSEYRRQGVGSKVLPIIEAHCHEKKCHAINLELNIGNAGARKFYEEFEYMPRRQHCIMTKTINKNLTSLPFSL